MLMLKLMWIIAIIPIQVQMCLYIFRRCVWSTCSKDIHVFLMKTWLFLLQFCRIFYGLEHVQSLLYCLSHLWFLEGFIAWTIFDFLNVVIIWATWNGEEVAEVEQRGEQARPLVLHIIESKHPFGGCYITQVI